MKRVIRNVFLTCDASTRRVHFFGDEILHADPILKVMLMPLTWQGDLQPVLDAYLEQLRPLENGLTLGRTLSAEEIGNLLDLGRTWLGIFQTKLLAASADFASAQRPEEAGAEPGTDVAEVIGQLTHLRREMGTGDRAKIADGMRRLRDAARRVSDSLPARDGMTQRRIADATARRIDDINAGNRAFWTARDTTPQLDSSGRMNWRTGDSRTQSTAFRDAQHAVAHAASPSKRIEAMNLAARAFWTPRGEPPTVTADALSHAPTGGTTAASINARNRAFWAGR